MTTACAHFEFEAHCDVARLSETDGGPITGYSVGVKIVCHQCKMAFKFIGLPGGSSPSFPTVSIDNTEARMPIGPSDTTASILDELEAANSGRLN